MPTLEALDDAMLRPGRAVPAVNRLGGGSIAMAGTDQPWRVIGSDAVVYQLRQPTGRVLALRCPLADAADLDPTLGERYRALAADPALAPLRAGSASPLVGGVSYVPDGLLFPAPDFRSIGLPVIALDWVMGPTVMSGADRACGKEDRPYLEALADAWLAAVEALGAARFSHGDLSADNAVVRPGGGVALVDYDACAWPGSPPPPPVRLRPGYSHPTGAVPPDTERRDDFPALVVYTSLRILALWPALRGEVPEPANRHERVLLFGPRDLDDPDASALFARLRVLDDLGVRSLLGALRQSSLGPVEQTPRLRDAAATAREAARIATVAPPPPPTPRPARGLMAPSPVATGASSWPTAPTWPAAPAPAPRAAAPPPPVPPRGLAPRPRLVPPPESSPSAGDPRERQARVTRLNSLLLAGDEDGAQRFWEASGLASDAEAARELGPRMDDLGRRRLLRSAREAAEEGDSATLLRLWAEGQFEDFRPAAPLQPMVEAARRRVQTVGRLEAALDTGDVATTLRLWPELRGDALASAFAIRANAVVAEHLGVGVAGAVARGDDAALVAAIRQAEAAGVAVDVSARRAARAAAARVEHRQELTAALAADDRESLAALALSGRLDDLGPLDPRDTRAVLRALAWPALDRALQGDDDAAILAGFDRELFGDGDALTAPQRARVALAGQRLRWLEEVRGALRRRDLPALWEAVQAVPTGAETRLTRVERTRIERLAAREEAVAALAVALRDGPDAAIVEALGRVEDAGALLPDTLDWSAVRGVVDRITLAEAIQEATSADPPDYVRVARLLAAARASAIARSGEATGGGEEADLARLETEMLRAAHLARLREALASDRDAAIAGAADPDPYGTLAYLTEDQRARVRRALDARGGRVGGRPA